MRERSKVSAVRWSLAPIALSVVTIAAFALLPTQPRFTHPALNYVFVILLALSVPLTLIVFAAKVQSRLARWSLAVGGILVALPVACIVFFEAGDLHLLLERGFDGSFELVDELDGASSTYRLYRTNGGATTSFGLVLREERQLVPGFKLVTFMRGFYPARDATFVQLPSGAVQVKVAAYGERGKEEAYSFVP